MQSSASEACPQILGTPITAHTNADGQHDSLGSGESKCNEKIKIDGHEIPLAAMQNQPEAIPTLLGRRKVKPRQLLYKALSSNTSSGNKGHFLNRYFQTYRIAEST
jgi:hypothetical protein